ncbi:MAG: 23S rRNA (pseudouridine(1915)-N(3))-methyltransferase RlmH, partial [Christensenellales bacterium]
MININIVCVGNLKEDYWQQAVKEYQKRISAFAKINIVEVKESAYGASE